MLIFNILGLFHNFWMQNNNIFLKQERINLKIYQLIN